MTFPIHTIESAPAGARPVLETIAKNYGFLPNLAATFATSPPVLTALLELMAAFDGPKMTLSPLQRQLVLLTVSRKNECEYCMSAHGMLAHRHGLSREDVARVQLGRPLDDAPLEALRTFTELVVSQRGRVSQRDIDAFLAAGYTPAQVLEVVLGVSLKTLTNYVSHIAKPLVNAQFEAFHPRTAAQLLA